MAKEYPGRPFSEEDLTKLGAKHTARNETPDYYSRPDEGPVVYNPHGFDVDPSELPEHHIELTQMNLKQLCNIVGGYFRDVFADFRGCEMRYDPKNGRRENGFLVFNLAFEYKNYSDSGKFNALVKYEHPIQTVIDLNKKQRTLELTNDAKGFLMKYMYGIEYGSDNKPFVNWNRYLEEKDLQFRTTSGYSETANLLIVTHVNLNEVVQDIWTDPKVKRADELAAINAWKRKHWKRVPPSKDNDNKDEFEKGKETDDEILSMCHIQRKYLVQVIFKGYQTQDANGCMQFSNVPINVLPNGQTQIGKTHDFSKYGVSVRVSNAAQIAHDFPGYSINNYNDVNFLLGLI